MKNLYIVSVLLLLLSACSQDHTKVIPESTGKTNTILLIMDNQDWKTEVGDSIRKYFAAEYSDLPQSEPIFSLQQAGFDLYNGIYKRVKDILIVKQGDNPGIRYYTDKDAKPQQIVVIEGKNENEVKELISKNAPKIVQIFNDFEVANLQHRHRKSLLDDTDIQKELGIRIEIPSFFNLVDHQDHFFWFRRDLKNGEQDILLYSVPLRDTLDFSGDKVICNRDSIGEKYIPGPSDGTFMKSVETISPSQKMLSIDHHKAIESRGLWDMKNDFMGGPYVNYTILDKKHKRMIVGEGFIYAPAIDKRDYIVQLEAILKTIRLTDE